MNAQRVGLRALRQAAVKKPNALFFENLPRLALGTNAASLQTRSASTQKLSETDAQSLLAAQRRQRPVSPHLAAYDYKQTWFGASIWTRITGQSLSVSFYAFSLAYLVAPLTGWHIESATLASAAASLSPAVLAGLKTIAAWPFFFHFANGFRHLTWDMTYGFKKATIQQTSYTVLGASLVATLGAVFLL
ncbi:Succinate dehydrogenase cytochrome B subunit, mitochondrial [Daldinia childiae]|uniref:Succinate dehydrogenase cytochrome B subunit, mitochondrial n=1 Tax=Daldinia childiae TaxID=326645 RepID=UPI001445AAAF|nr:Succinate dehydrogenase cytochrome B subunit, mitochondrial [Daldinia childiae]KAF3056655.1 Succinate dehydrogenase cytochrome B subunit, mitochondrial [Daldinia childiae]